MSGSLTKQPGESRYYDMDFSKLLGTTEAIITVDSVGQLIWNETDETWDATTGLTLGIAAAASPLAQVQISGGTNGETYKVTFTVTTDGPNILEGDGVLAIVEL